VVVGVLLASLSFGYFFQKYLNGDISLFNPLSSTNMSTIPFVSGEMKAPLTQNTQNTSLSRVPANVEATRTMRYVTRYIPTPLLPEIPRQPSWSELAYFWATTAHSEEEYSSELLAREAQSPSGTETRVNTNQNTGSTPIFPSSFPASTVDLPLSTNIPTSNSDAALGNGQISSFQERYSIGIRGITTLYSQRPSKSNIQPDAYFLENAAMYVKFNLTNNTFIGGEVGYDTYFIQTQRLNPQNTNETYINELYPTLWWIAGFIHQRIPLTEQLAATAQASLGATLIGAIGRSILGISYSPDARTEIHLGVEGSAIMYSDDIGMRFSPKLGLTYGVSVKF
jgi:hypothetical protein